LPPILNVVAPERAKQKADLLNGIGFFVQICEIRG
jgi:hypothetical protein